MQRRVLVNNVNQFRAFRCFHITRALLALLVALQVVVFLPRTTLTTRDDGIFDTQGNSRTSQEVLLDQTLATLATTTTTTTRRCLPADPEKLPRFETLANDTNSLGQCLRQRDARTEELTSYIAGLDLYVVTSGGTGSEAMIDYMHQHTNYTVRSQTEPNHGNTVHLGSPLFTPLVWNVSRTPTLVLIGDFFRAISSMHRRAADGSRKDLFSRNVAKNLYGAQECKRKSYQHFWKTYPNDPVGFKTMIWTYMHAATFAPAGNSRTVFLQAPYTQESIDTALRLIQMDHLADMMQGFRVKERPKHGNGDVTGNTSLPPQDVVQSMYKPYHELESMFRHRLPQAWLAEQTPCILAQYLLEELQIM